MNSNPAMHASGSRKSFYRKKTYRHKRYKDTPIYKELNQKISKLRSDEELKYLYKNVGPAVVMIPADSGSPVPSQYVACLNSLQQGVQSGTRIGDQISIKSLNLRLYTHGYNTFLNECRVRVVLVLWKCSSGTAFDPDLIFQGKGTIPYTIDQYTGDQVGKGKDFKILMDKQYDMIPSVALTATTVIPDIDIVQYNKRMNIKVQFNTQNTGTYADIDKNAIWLYVTTSGTSATINPYVFWTSKISYTDS